MTTRHCQRCGLELTDAASMNEGIGPICRKMDNEVLAQIIPANLHQARAAANAAIAAGVFHAEECRNTMEQVIVDLADDECRDWRKTVKRVEWMLSFAHNYEVKNTLISIAYALGYTALALVWTHQKGVAGAATVRVADGMLFVKGPRNAGALQLLRAMPGRRFEGATKEWSAPFGSFAEFSKAVRTGYPKHTIEGFDSWDALEAHCRAHAPARRSPTAVSRPMVRIKVLGALLLVEAPKNYDLIDSLKSLPYRDRRWSPAACAWEVSARHQAAVMSACERIFGSQPVVEAA